MSTATVRPPHLMLGCICTSAGPAARATDGCCQTVTRAKPAASNIARPRARRTMIIMPFVFTSSLLRVSDRPRPLLLAQALHEAEQIPGHQEIAYLAVAHPEYSRAVQHCRFAAGGDAAQG